MTPLLTVEEHRARVLAAVTTLPVETLPLADAVGRTLAAPVLAAHDLPGFDNSSMDGFAVRFADVEGADAENPVTLRVSPICRPVRPTTRRSARARRCAS